MGQHPLQDRFAVDCSIAKAPWNGAFFLVAMQEIWGCMKHLLPLLLLSTLQGCTLLAVADAAGSAVVYGVKTTVNVLDAVTPDIVNKK